jgi:hypothetical protein
MLPTGMEKKSFIRLLVPYQGLQRLEVSAF